MALILNIDTALDTACISLARGGDLLASAANESTKDHGAWLHPAIAGLWKKLGVSANQLDAVGVNIGPGSYTGLRIGLAAAKGICFALKVPLLTASSLKSLALSAKMEARSHEVAYRSIECFCPMIDARRMEVFGAMYDKELNEIIEPRALIVSSGLFDEYLERQKILFLGNGSEKFRQVCHNQNAMFQKIPLNPVALAALIYRNFVGNNFADLAYTEPLYLKEFFTN